MKTSAEENDGANAVADIASTALKNYEQAIRTGLKMQEEAGKWWSSLLNPATLNQEWQKQCGGVTGFANNLLPLAQKRLDDIMALMEKNNQSGAELLRKALEAARTPVNADSQAKWMDFWTSSMGAVRANAEAVGQFNVKTMDAWMDFIQKNAEATQARVTKAA